MPKSILIAALLDVADRYCAATGQSRAALAKVLFNRASLIDDMAAGDRDLTTGTYQRVIEWFARQWPTDAECPAYVHRYQSLYPPVPKHHVDRFMSGHGNSSDGCLQSGEGAQ